MAYVEASNAEDPCRRLADEAVKNGITINSKICSERIADRGLGVVARRAIQEGDLLVHVPTALMLTSDCVRKELTDKLGSITVHGLLAAQLTLGRREGNFFTRIWRATWPSVGDFNTSMPLLWPSVLKHRHGNDFEELRSLFPDGLVGYQMAGDGGRPSEPTTETSSLLKRQQEKLEKDWSIVAAAFPDTAYQDFVYHWFIVNSRSFYYDVPLRRKPKCKDDRMVLCPFIDLFNHSDSGCRVTFDRDGYSVLSDRTYAKGEEIYLCYGNHNNDFLLAEYGFMLDQNKWDCTKLDAFLFGKQGCPNKKIERRLIDSGYMRNYTLSHAGVCFRTEAAVRACTLTAPDWKRFIEGRPLSMSEAEDTSKANIWLKENVLDPYMAQTLITLRKLEHGNGLAMHMEPYEKSTLVSRWHQIREMLEEVIKRIGAP